MAKKKKKTDTERVETKKEVETETQEAERETEQPATRKTLDPHRNRVGRDRRGKRFAE